MQDAHEEVEVEDACEEVEVLVQHATQDCSSVLVSVSSMADMRAVKEAVAAKLERPEIVNEIELVRRAGSGFAPFEDMHKLGTRRHLLMMGIQRDNVEAHPGTEAEAQFVFKLITFFL